MFGHREQRLGVGVAVTHRHGGGSAAPYAELNLADHVGDDPAAVAANRERLRAALGASVQLVTMRQVHGADVAVVEEVPAEPPQADALVTTVRGLALVVLVADCTPVLLWDRRAGVIAAVHAGRRGLANGVLPATVSAMAGLGARPDRMYAAVGPSICPEHYEVPEPMRAEVAAAAPAAAASTSKGTPALDIRAGLLEQLRAAGVAQGMVMPQCTAEDPDYYSYRRDGTTGRFAGVVWREA